MTELSFMHEDFSIVACYLDEMERTSKNLNLRNNGRSTNTKEYRYNSIFQIAASFEVQQEHQYEKKKTQIKEKYGQKNTFFKI